MKTGKKNSYKSLKYMNINGENYKYYSLSEAEKNGLKGISKLPKSLKVILENLLRYEDDKTVTKNQIDEIKNWLKSRKSSTEILIIKFSKVILHTLSGSFLYYYFEVFYLLQRAFCRYLLHHGP